MSKPSESISQTDGRPECFVIMPFSDPGGYKPGHFRRVFEDIFKPACEKAGFTAVRADDDAATNMIHLEVLRRLLDSPLVLCDLSTRNPNVLFELGLRQAFDKPVVLVQEVGTPPIFDVTLLRYIDYHPELLYREVLEDQNKIAETIKQTMADADKQEGVNSLVRLLGLTRPASPEAVEEAKQDPALQIMLAELQELRLEIKGALLPRSRVPEAVAVNPKRTEDVRSRTTNELIRMQNLLSDLEAFISGYEGGHVPIKNVNEIMDAARGRFITLHQMVRRSKDPHHEHTFFVLEGQLASLSNRFLTLAPQEAQKSQDEKDS